MIYNELARERKLVPNIDLLQYMKKKLGLSYTDLGEALHKGRSAVQKNFTGQNKMSLEDALKLCEKYPELSPNFVFMQEIDFLLLETESMKYHALPWILQNILIYYWDLLKEICNKWAIVLDNFSKASNDVRYMYLNGLKKSGPKFEAIDAISILTTDLIDVNAIVIFREDSKLSLALDHQNSDSEHYKVKSREELEDLYDDYLSLYREFEKKVESEKSVQEVLVLVASLDEFTLDLIYYLALAQFDLDLQDKIINTWMNIELVDNLSSNKEIIR